MVEDQIKSGWKEGMYVEDLKDVANNLNRVLGKLHAWSRKYIGYIPKKLELARKKLDVLYKRNNPEDLVERERILKDMDELLYKEEML